MLLLSFNSLCLHNHLLNVLSYHHLHKYLFLNLLVIYLNYKYKDPTLIEVSPPPQKSLIGAPPQKNL